MRRTTLFLLSGLCLIAAPAFGDPARGGATSQVSESAARDAAVAEAAQRFGIPTAWIKAIMRAESAGDPHAISPKGAMGLMQLMPGTWAELRIRYRLGADPYDVHDNVIAGAAYLRELYDRYGTIRAALATYNAGPGRYEASLVGQPLPPETRAYVATLAPILGAAGIASAADAVSVGGSPAVPSTAPQVHDLSAIVPTSGDLFVARGAGKIVR